MLPKDSRDWPFIREGKRTQRQEEKLWVGSFHNRSVEGTKFSKWKAQRLTFGFGNKIPREILVQF